MTLATDKQAAFLSSLLDTRDVAAVGFDAQAIRDSILAGDLSKRDASGFIDALTRAPRVEAARAPRIVLEAGMYRVDGEIFRVQASRETGNLYAKRLNLLAEGAEFVYAPGALRAIRPEHRMSQDEARAWGVEMGICCVCAAVLTDPESVARGIGPVCGKRV